MPRYLTTHTMAGMTRQGAQQLAASLTNGEVRFLRFLVNMTGGRLFGEFESPGRDQLENYLSQHKIHFDSLDRVDIEVTAAGTADF